MIVIMSERDWITWHDHYDTPGSSLSRHAPDLLTTICDWFEQDGFERIHLDSDGHYGVGVHRYTGPPRPLEPGVRMFTFL